MHKSFGSVQVLRGVEFAMAAGEQVAFLGPNGAGKTTLIRCLSGRTKPSKGKVSLLGEPPGSAAARMALGLVPQEIAVYGDLTLRENLIAFGKFYGVTGRTLRNQVDWALQWTGLSDRAGDLVDTFSGGMQRRVNLACGVLHQPKVLLLDEPTVGVDPQSRERIFQMLDHLNDVGTSILLTTHHLDEAQRRSDRIIILDSGQVIADGPLSELVEQTVGTSRLVRVKVNQPLSKPLRLPARHADAQQCGSDTFETRIDNISQQLTALLDCVRTSGYQVSDVEVRGPTLHHVFLHLTGTDLRD